MSAQARAVARVVSARVAVAKAAMAPELRQMVNVEAALAAALWAVHTRASARAIAAVARAAAAQTGPLDVDALVGAARPAYEAEFSGPATQLLRESAERLYKLGKIAAWNRATGRSKTPLRYDFPESSKLAKAKAGGGAGFDVKFGLLDEQAVTMMQSPQALWIGEVFDAAVQDRIAASARRAMLEDGLGGERAGQFMRADLGVALGVNPVSAIPPGFTGPPRRYFQNLAANAATTGRVFGSMRAFTDAGVDTVEIVNPLDERTCPRCSLMDGRRFESRTLHGQMDRILGSAGKVQHPDTVRQAQPWLSEAKFVAAVGGKAKGDVGENRDLAHAGIGLPPYHFGCRCTIDVTEDAAEEIGLKPQPVAPGPSPGPSPAQPKAPKAPKKPKQMPALTPKPLDGEVQIHPFEKKGTLPDAADVLPNGPFDVDVFKRALADLDREHKLDSSTPQGPAR